MRLREIKEVVPQCESIEELTHELSDRSIVYRRERDAKSLKALQDTQKKILRYYAKHSITTG